MVTRASQRGFFISAPHTPRTLVLNPADSQFRLFVRLGGPRCSFCDIADRCRDQYVFNESTWKLEMTISSGGGGQGFNVDCTDGSSPKIKTQSGEAG